MIAIGVLGGGLGWIIHRVEVQRDAVAAIERAGGEVMYDWEWKWKKGRPVRTGTTRWPDWLVERIGVDYLSNSLTSGGKLADGISRLVLPGADQPGTEG